MSNEYLKRLPIEELEIIRDFLFIAIFTRKVEKVEKELLIAQNIIINSGDTSSDVALGNVTERLQELKDYILKGSFRD